MQTSRMQLEPADKLPFRLIDGGNILVTRVALIIGPPGWMLRSWRIGKVLSSIVVSLVLWQSVPSPAPDTLLVELAVAKYARSNEGPLHRLGFQNTPRSFYQQTLTDTVLTAYRRPEHIKALLTEAKASLITSPNFVFCYSLFVPECLETVFRIGIPQISGDSAKVWLYRLEQSGRDTFAASGLKLLLTRTEGKWSVVKTLDEMLGTFEPF
jgi:hypothetical protein